MTAAEWLRQDKFKIYVYTIYQSHFVQNFDLKEFLRMISSKKNLFKICGIFKILPI